jgi:hypothetical protein
VCLGILSGTGIALDSGFLKRFKAAARALNEFSSGREECDPKKTEAAGDPLFWISRRLAVCVAST